MRVLEWAVPRAYDPRTYLRDLSLPLEAGDPAAVAELMHGGMTKHECYLERDDAPARERVDPSDPDVVPAWCAWGFGEQIKVAMARPGTEFKCSFGAERDVAVPADALGRHFIAAVDGARTAGEILPSAAARWPGAASGRTRRRWIEFCEAFQSVAALALLHR
jgi:hypothetical protein